MGQLLLGFRSLIIKAVIFMIMAALLAWALGGTLFPQPHVAELRSDAARLGSGRAAYWRISIENRQQDHAHWRLMVRTGEASPDEPVDARRWLEGAGPVAAGGGVVYYGARDEDGAWRVVRLAPSGEQSEHEVAGRLEVERLLARAAEGLPAEFETAAEEKESGASLDSAPHSADTTQ